MSEIKISIEELNKNLKNLKQSIESYKPLMEKFISFTKLDLERQKSDFCSNAKLTLNNMGDVYNKKNAEQSQKIYTNGIKIIEEFKKVDEKII